MREIDSSFDRISLVKGTNMRYSTLLLSVAADFGIACTGGFKIKGWVLEKTGAGIPQATVKLRPSGIVVLTGNDARFFFSTSASDSLGSNTYDNLSGRRSV